MELNKYLFNYSNARFVSFQMEDKPEQLATLLAAGQQTTVTAVNSMSAVGSLAAVNGNPAIVYRQVRP